MTTSSAKPIDYEISFEHDMTLEKLREMASIVENAAKHAHVGQTLRLKVNHNTTFVFKDLVKIPVAKGQSYESRS